MSINSTLCIYPSFGKISYQAEAYLAWVVLQSRVPSASAWRGATWTFSDSQSYISVLESRNDGNCPFISALLQPCRSVSSHWEIPHRLYSHRQGTFVDEVLERVDSYANDLGLWQQPASGWIAGLQDPTVCFVDRSAPCPYQVHDPQPLFRHHLRRYLREAVSLPPIQDNPRYVFYRDPIMKSFITWGVQPMIVAIRHNVGAAPGVVCLFCGATPSMRNYVEQCHLFCVFSFTPGFCSLSRISARDGEFLRLLGMKFASYMDTIFSASV